jgi:hypothetical protein
MVKSERGKVKEISLLTFCTALKTFRLKRENGNHFPLFFAAQKLTFRSCLHLRRGVSVAVIWKKALGVNKGIYLSDSVKR